MMLRHTLLVLAIVPTTLRYANAQVIKVTSDLAEDWRHKWPDKDYMYSERYLTGVPQVAQTLEMTEVGS